MTEVTTGNNDQIILGDESSHQAISFKMAQAFYNEITGRSEKITEKFNKSFILTIENVEQLHKRIIQSTAQYNVASANASFSVEYKNDSSERFSSIARFKTHAGSKGVPVKEANLNYNLLFVLPGTNRPQEYRIHVRLISRMVKMEEIRERWSDMFSVPIWQFDDGLTCESTIEYVDITVANSLMSIIKEWNNGLDEVKSNNIVVKIRPWAKYMPSIFKYGLLAVGVYFTSQYVESYFVDITSHSTATFILIAYLFNFLLWRFGQVIGFKLESHANQLYEISYISFSGADNNLAATCSTTKRNNIIFGFIYFIFTFVAGFLSSGIASLIFTS